MNTIVCGIDSSPGARAGLRIAAALADVMDARLIAVHVHDRLIDTPGSAERIAGEILYEEVPDASADARARSATSRSGSPPSRAKSTQT